MRCLCGCVVLVGLAGFVEIVQAEEKIPESGQVLFNGQDLTGWKFRGGDKAADKHEHEEL